MEDNIPDSKFLSRLSGDMNHNLLSHNTDGNITYPELINRRAGDMNQNLEFRKELEHIKKISRKRSKDVSSGRVTKHIKTIYAGVADGMLGIFTPRCNSTDIPDIDNDNPLFDITLPMIHHIATLTPNEREEFLKYISYGDTIRVHDEIPAKGIPAVIEM